MGHKYSKQTKFLNENGYKHRDKDTKKNKRDSIISTNLLAKCISDQTLLIEELIEIIIEYRGNEPQIRGELYKKIGEFGFEPLQFNRPCAIASDGLYIYISDKWNNRIQVMNKQGEFIRSWGEWGEANGNFRMPCGLVIYKSQIYIADNLNKRIQIFSIPKGTFIRKIQCHRECYNIQIYKSYIYVIFDYSMIIGVYSFEGELINEINCLDITPKYKFCTSTSLHSLDIHKDEIYVLVRCSRIVICLSIYGQYKYLNECDGYGQFPHNKLWISTMMLTDESIFIGEDKKIIQLDRTWNNIREFGISAITGTVGCIIFEDNVCFVTDVEDHCIYIFK